MKAEELSVGDYVYANGMEIHKIVSIITNNEGNPIIDTIGVYNYGSAYIDNIKPIHITQGMLEKNGFIQDFDGYISEDGRILVNHLSNTIGKDWYCHIDNEDFETIASADIQYVHELQHLLRLSNIEKEIEL